MKMMTISARRHAVTWVARPRRCSCSFEVLVVLHDEPVEQRIDNVHQQHHRRQHVADDDERREHRRDPAREDEDMRRDNAGEEGHGEDGQRPAQGAEHHRGEFALLPARDDRQRVVKGPGHGDDGRDEERQRDHFPCAKAPERLVLHPGGQHAFQLGRPVDAVERGQVLDRLAREDPDRLPALGLHAVEADRNRPVVEVDDPQTDGPPGLRREGVVGRGVRLDCIGHVGQREPVDDDPALDDRLEHPGQLRPGAGLPFTGDLAQVHEMRGGLVIAGLRQGEEALHRGLRRVAQHVRRGPGQPGIELVDLVPVGGTAALLRAHGRKRRQPEGGEYRDEAGV
jgi:hypothetical protein